MQHADSFSCGMSTSLVAQTVKRLSTMRRPGFNPWVGKIPWRRKWQPTPVLLPGKFHGLRSRVGYSPCGRKESDTTERLHFTSDVAKPSPLLKMPVFSCDIKLHRLVPPDLLWHRLLVPEQEGFPWDSGTTLCWPASTQGPAVMHRQPFPAPPPCWIRP